MRSRWYIALVLSVLVLPVLASGSADAELQRLTSALQKAKTQTDMNLASKRLADYWDDRLAGVQAKIERKLDAKERKQFVQSNKRWLSYRAGEVAFRAGFYKGGSIQPLVANTAYSEITEHRVSELESLLSEGLAARAGGAANRGRSVASETNRTSAAASPGG